MELFFERARGARISVEDAMPIRVDGDGDPVGADHLAEEEEIAVGIFLEAKDGTEHAAGGIIDDGEQDEPRPTSLEPRVVATVHLDEEAGLGHAFPAAAMARGATGTGTAHPGLPEKALDGLAGEVEAFPLRQQLREVMIIEAGIRRAGQRKDAGANRLGDAASGGPSPMAVRQRGEPMLAQAGEEATEVAQREAEQMGSLSPSEGPMLHAHQDMHTLLLLWAQGNRLPDHAPRVTFLLSC